MFSAVRRFLASLFACMSRAVDDEPPAIAAAQFPPTSSTINLNILVNSDSPSAQRRAYSESLHITLPLAPEGHPDPILHSASPPKHRRLPHSPASSRLPVATHRDNIAEHEPIYSQIKKGPK